MTEASLPLSGEASGPVGLGPVEPLTERDHDKDKLIAFFSKYALGTLAKPSCLVCGRNDFAWPPAIQHIELLGIVVCHPCRDAAVGARVEHFPADMALAVNALMVKVNATPEDKAAMNALLRQAMAIGGAVAAPEERR